MTKITDSIKSLKDCMEKLELLEDKEYLEANWITEDDAKLINNEIIFEIKKYESEVQDYLNYISKLRQEASMNITWLQTEINRLEELLSWYSKKVDRYDKWIDLILKNCWIEKLSTNLYQFSYRKSESVEIYNEEMLPKWFIKESVLTRPDKAAIKEALKNWAEVPGAIIKVNQNLQIK